MKKIIPIKHKKIWGYEIWLHSPLKKSQSKLEDGTEITDGPLIKIIKANSPLSVQVHPDDILAGELEGEKNGKAECWYVLESTNKSEFIVGVNNFKIDSIRKSLRNNTFENYLIKINPSIGSFINVPPGLVHGIGKESKVLEIQQPSDITYRFYDYNRLKDGKARELHIEKSLMSLKPLDWKIQANSKGFYEINKYKIKIFHKPSTNKSKSIVVDLKEEIAYIVDKNEKINFKHWALIK